MYIKRPNNKNIDIRQFKFQLTDWYDLQELEPCIEPFRKDRKHYGKKYIIKKNTLTGLYAIFTKGENYQEKSNRRIKSVYLSRTDGLEKKR